MPTLKRIYQFLYTAYFKFLEHNGFLLSAGIAFFIFFSLFPLLILIAIVVGSIIQAPELQRKILDSVFSIIPSMVDYIQTGVIEPLITHRSAAGIIAIVSLLWSGLGFFGGLASGLNAVYGVKETRDFIRIRIWALIVSTTILALLVVSILASSFASTLRDQIFSLFFPAKVATFAWILINYSISIVTSLLLFYIVYKLVPSIRMPFRHLWLGTLTAGGAWEIGKYVFTFYISAFASKSYGLIYGSLASIVILMFWLYISAGLLLFGAEMNAEHNRRTGGAAALDAKQVS